MTNGELERKSVKESLRYNTKYAEDSELDKVLKYPEKFVDHFKHTKCIVKLLREKAYWDGYIDGAKELEKENEKLRQQIGLYKEMLNRNPCVRIPDWHCSDCLEENTKLKQANKRAKVLLKATLDLLQKQKDSYYVLNLLETTSFYDEAECDGYCLFDDIENFLNFGN